MRRSCPRRRPKTRPPTKLGGPAPLLGGRVGGAVADAGVGRVDDGRGGGTRAVVPHPAVHRPAAAGPPGDAGRAGWGAGGTGSAGRGAGRGWAGRTSRSGTA